MTDLAQMGLEMDSMPSEAEMDSMPSEAAYTSDVLQLAAIGNVGHAQLGRHRGQCREALSCSDAALYMLAMQDECIDSWHAR